MPLKIENIPDYLSYLDKVTGLLADILVITDEHLNHRFISRSAEKHLGYSIGELKQKPLINLLQAKDQTHFLAFLKTITNQPGNNLKANYRLQHKNKSWLNFEVSVLNLLHDKQVNALVFKISNINNETRSVAHSIKIIKDLDHDFNTASSAMFLVKITKDRRFLYVLNNHAHQKKTGLSLADIACKTPEEVLGDKLGASLTVNYTKCLNETTAITYEEIDAHDADNHWLTTLTPVIENGKVSHIIGSSLNIMSSIMINKLKESAYEKLVEADQKYKSLFSSVKDGIVMTTIDGTIIDANEAYIRMLGYQNMDELQFNYRAITPAKWHRFEQNLVDKIIIPMGYSGPYEKEYIRKNESIFPISIETWLITNANKEPTGMWAIVKDLTEHKETRKKLQYYNTFITSVLETTHDGFMIVDAEKRILDVNRTMCKLTGFTRDELLMMDVNDLSVLESPSETEARIERIIRNGSEIFETQIRKKDGTIIDVEFSVIWIDIDRKMACFCREITDRKLFENSLQKTIKQLGLLNQHNTEVREMERAAIANEIHDTLGQAMTALKIDLGWISNNLHDQAACNKKIHRMLDLTSETISRMHRISAELRPGILDDLGLNAAIEWYCSDLKERTGIKYELLFADNCKSFDKKIEVSLFRIMQEAVTNVIRHAKAASVKILLSCPCRHIQMVIEDDGIGIPVEALSSNKSFGLLSMRERVQYFGGSMEVINNPKGGVILKFNIPFVR